jgi:peptidyl-prolyl cis-trans isomerase A (cyclophilin A)
MVRSQDPNSQGSQFFIVVNRELEESVSREIESYKEIQDHVVGHMADGSPFPMAMYFPERVIDEYQTVGGIPGLDMTYTVFGHVIDGFDVIDAIASVETSQDEETLDKPLEDIVIERITFENFSSNLP